METLAKLKRRIPASYALFCGHGPETTMAQELAHNPWLQDGEHASDGMH
jgi:glyoxylase-like metal-dependent hydrolase (beta-lactamase superfamily II)